ALAAHEDVFRATFDARRGALPVAHLLAVVLHGAVTGTALAIADLTRPSLVGRQGPASHTQDQHAEQQQFFSHCVHSQFVDSAVPGGTRRDFPEYRGGHRRVCSQLTTRTFRGSRLCPPMSNCEQTARLLPS